MEQTFCDVCGAVVEFDDTLYLSRGSGMYSDYNAQLHRVCFWIAFPFKKQPIVRPAEIRDSIRNWFYKKFLG